MPNTHVVICFFGANQKQYYSHCQMRTLPLLNELKKYFTYCYFNPSVSMINKFEYKKFFLIRIKLAPIPEKFLNIKNKCIIWDIIDILQHTLPSTLWDTKRFIDGYNLCDVINCPNSMMQNIIQKKNYKKKHITMIPHNWDPRVKKYFKKATENLSLDKPKLVFLGTPNSKEESNCINNSSCISSLGRTVKEKDIGTFNLCCSLRNSSTAFGKPGTKSFVATSLNSLIIASKSEYNVLDLFGPEYPYYLRNDGKTLEERLEKTMAFVNKTYKQKEWKQAVDIAKRVRERTSIDYIGNQFKNLILDHV